MKKEGKQKDNKGKRKIHTCVRDIHGVCKKCEVNISRRKPKIFC